MNNHYWASENPHGRHQHRFAVNVWAAIINFKIVAKTHGRKCFLNLLTGHFQQIINELPLHAVRDLQWFPLDGAPVHFSTTVREWYSLRKSMDWKRRSSGGVAT